ncbi:hypothetical protein [Capnocytophaga sp.]|uniref:hypothetical protein n=1 Tax=Capnocytophaga sp. TaxID=44737 RepID=UPI0026DC711F|nr:hypothetical protein [Capnocytophaga sp.]MDO5105961.1 hypothetical protein [Capnocytophaga sp.]
MKQEIIKKKWDYSFYIEDDKYILSVICGSVALYEVKIQLNFKEIETFNVEGESYIIKLVKEIQYSPSKFTHRNIM